MNSAPKRSGGRLRVAGPRQGPMAWIVLDLYARSRRNSLAATAAGRGGTSQFMRSVFWEDLLPYILFGLVMALLVAGAGASAAGAGDATRALMAGGGFLLVAGFGAFRSLGIVRDVDALHRFAEELVGRRDPMPLAGVLRHPTLQIMARDMDRLKVVIQRESAAYERLRAACRAHGVSPPESVTVLVQASGDAGGGLAAYFEGKGCRVVLADEPGGLAEEAARVQPDLVLLTRRPEAEAVGRLRSASRSSTLAAVVDKDNLEAARPTGCDLLVTRPVRVRDLHEILQAVEA